VVLHSLKQPTAASTAKPFKSPTQAEKSMPSIKTETEVSTPEQ